MKQTNKQKSDKNFYYENLLTFVKGFIIGSSNVVPGISGGTIALIMGIYKRFIKALNDISKWVTSLFSYLIGFKAEKKALTYKNFKDIDWIWVIFLFTGRGIAILLVSALMRYLFENFPGQTYGTFCGLILASVFFPYEKMKKKGLKELIAMIIAFVLLFWFSGLETFETTTEPALWLLVISGIVATSAMILPGISGSFLLVMLGVHFYIFGLASLILEGQLSKVILPFILYGFGWLVGILSFSRLLNLLLNRYYNITMAFLIGLMLGSLRKIYPFFLENTDKITELKETPKIMMWDMTLEYLLSSQFISTLICMIVGFTVIFIVHMKTKT
jgi:putative membrane protein